MQWNHSKCESCGHSGETMTFGGHGHGPQLECPRCGSSAIKLLGFPVWKGGVLTYQPHPDPAQEPKKLR